MAERTVPATHMPTLDALEASKMPGSYCFVEGGEGGDGVRLALWYICPCGCGELMYLPLKKHPLAPAQQPRGWDFDGNHEIPTINPSIRRLGGCYYHGFLTKGVWTFQGDSGVRPARPTDGKPA